jgi:hypothetical protein
MIGQWPQPSLLLEYGIVGMLCEPIFSQPITEAKNLSGGQSPAAARQNVIVFKTLVISTSPR